MNVKSIKIIESFFICFFFSMLFSNCQKDKLYNDLELVLENNSVKALCPNDECLTETLFNSQFNNVISISLKNNSSHTYFLIPNCLNQNTKGCSFSSKPGFLSLDNFIIREGKNSVEIDMGNSFYFHQTDFEKTQDSLIESNFEKLGYAGFEVDFYLRNYLNENIIIIPPKATIFFENYLSLPLNFNVDESRFERLILNKNKKYKLALAIVSDVSQVEHLLTNSIKKTIEKNNFKIFDGELISNEVPLKIIEE